MKDKMAVMGNTISFSVGSENEEEKILLSLERTKCEVVFENAEHICVEFRVIVPKTLLKKKKGSSLKKLDINGYSVLELNRSDVPEYLLVAIDEKTSGLIVNTDEKSDAKNLIPIVRDLNGTD